eukprot:s3479_g7.t1
MGWQNSVGVMQELSEKWLSNGDLRFEHRLARGHSLPPWMNAVLGHARTEYLDNYAGGERILPGEPGTSAQICHDAAEQAWKAAGVVSSGKKLSACEQQITELGAEVNRWVDFAEQLTTAGFDFLQACEKVERSPSKAHAPIPLLSLFNGIGGSFRCYDLIGIVPRVRVAVDVDDAANRVTMRRWPGTVLVKDVHNIYQRMVREWSLKYLDISEIHVWGGWPCVDLSSARHGRLNLEGPQSSPFWESLRILKLLKDEFGSAVIVRHVLENVASMNEDAAQEISDTMGTVP